MAAPRPRAPAPHLEPPLAVVPLKALPGAKGRLARGPAGTTGLAPADRQELVAWMCGRVLAALAASPVAGVLAVAGDEGAAAVARAHGVEAVVVPAPGLGAAMAAADAATAGAAATLVVAADLPLLTPDDVAAVCACREAVVVAPTRDGGTGGLLRRPPTAIATAYGPGSAQAHLAAAGAAGLPARCLTRRGFAFDVDTATHLRAVATVDAEARRWSLALSSPA